MDYDLLEPNEPFVQGKMPMELTIGQFWSYMYSNLWDDMHGNFAEFLVAKALGIEKPTNKAGWRLWDIDYKGKRIEVKSTADWHCWNKEDYKPSKQVFNINKSHIIYKDTTSELKRQSDVYVFAHLVGCDKESSNPLELDHWEFYVVPTWVINERSGDNKTITLKVVEKLANKVSFQQLQATIEAAMLSTMPRGKQLCAFLRSIRVKIAEANGIPFAPHVCTHVGDCSGTCPLCDQELDMLESEIRGLSYYAKIKYAVLSDEERRVLNLIDSGYEVRDEELKPAPPQLLGCERCI